MGLINIKLSQVKPVSADVATLAPWATHSRPSPSTSTPTRPVVVGEEGAAPQLSGPADEVQRLLGALGRQLGYPADGAGLVRVLRVQPGEVDLQLAVAHCHGGAALCDSAFQTLRGLLPDTDIYVSPAG